MREIFESSLDIETGHYRLETVMSLLEFMRRATDSLEYSENEHRMSQRMRGERDCECYLRRLLHCGSQRDPSPRHHYEIPKTFG